MKSTSVIKIATMKITDGFRCTKEANWTYSGMPKGTSWVEVMLNSKNQAHSLSCYQLMLV